MTVRIPLILNQATARIEELAAADSIPGTTIEAYRGRNALINGDFRFWQRSTSQAERATGYTPLYLTADRWYMACNATKLGMSRQEFTPGQSAVPGNPKHYLRMTSNSGLTADSLGYFGQTIEGVESFAGEIITLSFYAKGSTSAKLGISFVQTFGSGGSGDTNTVLAPVVLSTAWQRYTVTLTLPSIAGKTITTNDHVRLRFWLDAGSNFTDIAGSIGYQTWTVDISNVKIEGGATATDFEKRPDALELTLCQRYCYSYEISSGGGFTTAIGLGNNQILAFLELPVTMRVIPSATSVAGAPTLTGAGGGSAGAATGQNYIPIGVQRVALVATFASATAGNAVGYLGAGPGNYKVIMDAEL